MPHYIMNYTPSKVHCKSQVPKNAVFIKHIQHNGLNGPLYELQYNNIVLPSKPTEENIQNIQYEAVDLGLSVKWASCNVGASNPWEYGLLFQYGRTDGYAYGDENHRFSETNPPITTSGAIYKVGDTLSLADDAAHANMGGNWRMPTETELAELKRLQHEFIKINGVIGIKFTGNGNSIFIPNAGEFDGMRKTFNDKNRYGHLYTSTTAVRDDMAYYMFLYENSMGYGTLATCKYDGVSVRGVC